jgi:hypothetical protein
VLANQAARVPSMQREIDQLGYSVRVEPDRGSAVQLVLALPKHVHHPATYTATYDELPAPGQRASPSRTVGSVIGHSDACWVRQARDASAVVITPSKMIIRQCQ